MEIKVSFKRKVVEVNNYPFEILINGNLLEDEDKEEFTWHWFAELQRFDDSEEEYLALQKLMVEIIQKIIKIVDVKIVGTTLHKNLYEIIFYAKEADTAKIGGEFAEMPSALEDREDRFLRYSGKRDTKWENVQPYFELIRE